MRLRLIVVFTIPGVLLYVLLGAAYAMSMARSGQQEVHIDRLADASYLLVTSRQSLLADDPSVVQSGEVWASNGLNVDDVEERLTALAGRRSEVEEGSLPWELDRMVIAEPVFEGGDLIGAVVTSSTTDRLGNEVWMRWALLAVAGLVALGAAILIASRLAGWVLRPVHMVDDAMAQIQHGEMSARIPESAGPPELRQVIAQFNAMAEKVEQLIGKQQEFVSNASHELRNPLNALLLRVEDLALSMRDEHAEELEHVRAEGRRMTRILDALLMLARDEDMAADSEPVEVRSVVARRVDGWQAIAAEKDVAARLDGAREAWSRIDEIVLESAFDAVMDNAVKFAPSGSAVDVSIAADSDYATISIRDHGPGLAAEEIAKVTDRFWRSPDHRNVRGSGLGLAIAAELLDSCGGRLAVAPADGGGLVVSLQVPLEPSERKAQA